MAVALRLFRLGKRNSPSYRIVAINRRSKRNGKYIELIGTYNPLTNPYKLKINSERFNYWQANGAIISEGLTKLLKNNKIV